MSSLNNGIQFAGLEARPGNLQAIFEKNMMLARNRMHPLGFDGSQVIRSAIPSFEANSLRASLAPPEPYVKSEEEIAEENRIADELEFKRQEAIRVAREAEERRRAEEAEKERLRLAEIARKQADVQARWDAAHNKVKIDLSGVSRISTNWANFATERFEETRTQFSMATGFLPARLSDSQMGDVTSPVLQHFKDALTPRSKGAENVEVEFVPEEAVEAEADVKEVEAVVVEATEVEAVVEEPAAVEEADKTEEEVQEEAPQYCQAEPVPSAESVVSPVSVTTQERSSPLHVKTDDKLKKDSAPTTATTSLDVEAEQIADVDVDLKNDSTDASSGVDAAATKPANKKSKNKNKKWQAKQGQKA